MKALSFAMKKNKNITKIDLDDKLDIKVVSNKFCILYCILR